MTRPTLEVADILRAQGDRFLDRYRSSFDFQQLKAFRAIQRCRTAALGGHQDACLRCGHQRSEEHTSELQSQSNLVCRLLLEKKHSRYFPCDLRILSRTHRRPRTKNRRSGNASKKQEREKTTSAYRNRKRGSGTRKRSKYCKS